MAIDIDEINQLRLSGDRLFEEKIRELIDTEPKKLAEFENLPEYLLAYALGKDSNYIKYIKNPSRKIKFLARKAKNMARRTENKSTAAMVKLAKLRLKGKISETEYQEKAAMVQTTAKQRPR